MGPYRQVLRKRIDHLTIEGMRSQTPVTWDLVREMFELFHGDLRGMFAALEEACFSALGSLRAAPLERAEARLVLAPLYREQLLRDLTATEIEHLAGLSQLDGLEFRQSDAMTRLGLSQGRISRLFGSLERSQAITSTRREGRNQFYCLAGRARLALGLGG